MTALALAPLTPTGVLVTAAEPGSTEWFAARRDGITGTDLPKILGDSPYGNALSVWLDKRGQAPEDTLGEAGQWGHLLEDVVATEWARREGAEVVPVGVLAHAEHTWKRASLDRLVVPGTCHRASPLGCGLEVKTRSAFKAGHYRDDVPDDVLAQVAWGLGVTGLGHMHVAVLIGGQELRTFTIEREPDLEAYLAERAADAWGAVISGVAPDVAPDGAGVLLDLLNRLHTDRDGETAVDPALAYEWVEKYRDGADLERAGAAAKTEAKTALVALLGDAHTALAQDRVLFTYKRPAPGVAMPAKEVKRLAKADPTTYAALREAGYLQPTAPGPRFDLKETL